MIFFFTFCVFLHTTMYILNITRTIEKKSVNKIRDFIFENYFQKIGFSKENNYYSMKRLKKKDLLLLAKKLIEKKSHPHNAEKNSLIRKKTPENQ